jgi:tRNA threonylcarbamoyladenosine biosynthesis protein TsaE
VTNLDIVEARPGHATAVADLIHRSFVARPPVDPPPSALTEDADSVAGAISASGGLVALLDDRVVGSLLFDHGRPGWLGLRRVSVDPGHQEHGIASAIVGVAETVADERGADGLWLWVREELPTTVRFWSHRGYVPVGRDGVHTVVQKPLPVRIDVVSPAAMASLATRLAPQLRAGDLLILTGELGAGKTTFTQSLGEALGVRGPITSPTFVLSRIHPSLVGGPDLVHVDAYRLGSAAEVDDLDLDATADRSVTVVEWGEDRAEQIADSWLRIAITDVVGDSRRLTVAPHGPRWADVSLRTALG